MSVSLDGVMAPMKDGERQAVRASQRADGKRTKGPAGYREVGCATLSFHDAEGERLSTVRMARMPESKKATLKSMLSAELDGVVTRHPELTLVKLADGAKDNWTYLHGIFPEAEEVVDYFHAVSHLKKAFDAAYGENTTQALGQFKKYRHILRDDANGVEKVIRALVYLRKHHPRRKAIATELGYFRGHRHRMRYAQMTARDLPIGSGIVEAACKTLVTQRMKRSGMRWRHEGGQAILTFRSLIQSGRFNAAWGLVADLYQDGRTARQHCRLSCTATSLTGQFETYTQLFAGKRPAFLRQQLVFEMDPGDASALELARGPHHIHRIAKSGVCVADHRKGGDCGNRGSTLGKLTHREHADIRIAVARFDTEPGHVNRLVASFLHDSGSEPVVDAWRDEHAITREQLTNSGRSFHAPLRAPRLELTDQALTRNRLDTRSLLCCSPRRNLGYCVRLRCRRCHRPISRRQPRLPPTREIRLTQLGRAR